MSRKRAGSTFGVEPPDQPTELALLSPPVVLSDEDTYSAVVITDAELSGNSATDLGLDQVLCRRVRLTRAELERAQFTDDGPPLCLSSEAARLTH